MNLIVEGFAVENLIKEGGFAGVYKVRRILDKKIFAMKVLNPKATAEISVRSQFYREAKLLSYMKHPHIIKVFEIVRQAPRPAILMEYFESDTLYTLILNKSPMLYQKGLVMFREIAQALSYLHEHKIIHKDIKPENILIAANGDVRLIDFSLAEKLSFLSFLTRRKRQGTPLYMSPEQIRREKLDCRTDIYSLGATFYQAFTGVAHIKADSEKALLQQQLKATIPKMRQYNKLIPYQVENILLRMLKKKPEERYQSMQEMLFELKRFTTEDYLIKPGDQPEEGSPEQ